MRGSACWSDHFMIRGKVKVALPRLSKEDHVHQCAEKRETYQQKLDEYLQSPSCLGAFSGMELDRLDGLHCICSRSCGRMW